MTDETAEIDHEFGRWLFTQRCDFTQGATNFQQLPETDLEEIAFAGRSNVGKSSLINALTGRKTLARTSNTPGRTQQINFFDLGERLVLVDLPGYGYARASKKSIAQWTGLIEDYLKGRPQLRRVCLLIDARHGLKDTDKTAMSLMDNAAVSYQIVLTKADKVKTPDLDRLVERTGTEISTHVAAHPDIMITSATKGIGIVELRSAIAALAKNEVLG